MSDDAIKEQVKEATDIVAVIGQYVTLRKRGASHIGLCPFHTEKTPSFNVHADRGFFHCFGCGKGGDVFAFLMEHEGWSFPEALKYCADRAGIRLPERSRDDDAQARRRQEVYDALALADEIYRRALFASAGTVALDYLKKRGFKEETLKRIGVGYAPPPFDTLMKTARARGLKPQAFLAAGLVLESKLAAASEQPYDRFRHRVTFPIHNLSGKVVGFGARAISPDDQPKYLNSPETEVYHKGRILYGLWTAREAIRRADRAFVVEGYLDWLTMIEFGVENVVAVSGTAFTIEQAELLGRFCKRMTLIFDADSAGQRATLRGIDIAFNAGVGVDVAILPSGDDPDTYLRREGTARFESLVTSAPSIIAYRVGLARSDPGGFDFLAKERLAKEFLALAEKINDPTRRAAFLNDVARHVELPVDQSRIGTRVPSSEPRDTRKGAPTRRESILLDKEKGFLRLLVERRDYAETARAELQDSDFEVPLIRHLFHALMERTQAGVWATTPRELGADSEEVARWAHLLSEPVDPLTADKVFADGLKFLKARRERNQASERYKALIAKAQQDGDHETQMSLLKEYSELVGAARMDDEAGEISPESVDTH
jgi:DNA primase